MHVDKVLLAEMLLQGSAAGFIHGAASQVLVAILAVTQVFLESNMDIMSLLEMILNGPLGPQMAVAIGAVRHFSCSSLSSLDGKCLCVD